MSIRELIKEEYLIIEEKLERVLGDLKNNVVIKIEKDNNMYDLVCGYGVVENMWFLVAIKDSLTETMGMKPIMSEGLAWRINLQKDEMIEEDYFLQGMFFYCLDSENDYNEYIDSLENKFDFHEINKVYIKDDKLIICLN